MSSETSQPIEDKRRAGLAARALGDHETALAAFRQAAARDGRDLWSRHDIAVELKSLGRTDEAEAAFRDALAGTPAAHSLRGLALLARSRGRHAQALALLGAAVLLLPDDPWFALDIVLSLKALGRLDEALASCSALAAGHPGFAPALCEEADLLAGLGRTGEARTVLARLLVRQPACLEAYRALARIARTAGDAQGALAHLRAAARLSPEDPQIRMDLADAYRGLGRRDEAAALYRALLPHPAFAVPARLELSACLRWTQGSRAALALVEEARALDPAHPRPALLLADDARERGELDRAAALYDGILAIRPGFYWALVGMAATARLRGDAETTLRFFEAAVEADPAEGHAQIERAAALRELGDWQGARAALAAVPPHSPRAASAAMGEGMIRRAEGDFVGASAAFLDVALRFPGHVEARLEAAEDLFRSGRGEEAERILELLRREAPDRPAVLEALARRALIREDPDEAEACLERAARLGPDRLWPPLALARIRALGGDGAGALALLDDCETRFGRRPDIELARADHLRQTGETAAMRDGLGRARALFAHHPMLRHAAIVADIDAGRFEAAEQALAAMPEAKGPTGGRIAFLRSLLACARWDLAAAVEHGERAVAALPGDGWVRNRLIHAALLDMDVERAGRHLADLAALEASANALRGKSANPSQSHYGQIHDEFRLDRDVLHALRAARLLPRAERSRALASIVRANGDSTLAAIQFFVDRRMRAAQPAPAGAAIPRVIHQYWDEPALPPDLGRYAASWRNENPGYGYRLWDETGAREFLARLPGPVLAAFDRAVEPAMKADLFRLALLHETGGIYADADDRCLAGIEPLLSGGHGMVAYQEDLGSLGNNFIAAAPRHPVLARALERATAAVNRGDTDILWLSTGPGLLTRAAAEMLCVRPEGEGDLLVLDRHEFLGHVAIHCLAAYKATDRHWSRTAFGRARGAQAARMRSA